MQRGHIVISFISDLLPKRVMTYVEIILNSAAVLLFSILVWRLLAQSIHMKNVGLLTPELRIPEWPFLLVTATIGISVYVLSLVLTVGQHAVEATRK